MREIPSAFGSNEIFAARPKPNIGNVLISKAKMCKYCEGFTPLSTGNPYGTCGRLEAMLSSYGDPRAQENFVCEHFFRRTTKE